VSERTRPILVFGALWCALAGGQAEAWGPTGHRAVGRIAEGHLTPAAAHGVAELLSGEPLAYVATWADEIRSEPEWKKGDPWHWVTIPDGQSYQTAAKNPEGDIVEAIGRFERRLADRYAPRLERVQALKWLAHLVGDIHQPLHAGRGDDRGGNEVLVLWFGEPTDLHDVWDSRIIDRSRLSFSELAELVGPTRAEDVLAWQASGPADWAHESQALRGAAYALGDRKLSYLYEHAHWPTIRRRVQQAGVRLSGVLNRIFATR
jgi:hypothetical protein